MNAAGVRFLAWEADLLQVVSRRMFGQIDPLQADLGGSLEMALPFRQIFAGLGDDLRFPALGGRLQLIGHGLAAPA